MMQHARQETDALATELDILYRDHAADLTQYVGRRVPRAQVDDICHDVWLAARDGLPRQRHECAPRVWLRVLARARMIELWRASPELATLDATLSVAPELAVVFGAKSPTTPSRQRARAEAARALHRALAEIDEVDREMIALRFLDGLDAADIARVVGVRANTVAQRIVRVVRRLKALLATG
jgi:RNA polymerase sigma factor (sigma-70 family)